VTGPSRARTLVGATLLALAATSALVLLLQPWATCPDDDVPAACPVPEGVTGATYAGCAAGVVAGVDGAAALTWPARAREDAGAGRARGSGPPR
jgi:hypothetical protein